MCGKRPWSRWSKAGSATSPRRRGRFFWSTALRSGVLRQPPIRRVTVFPFSLRHPQASSSSLDSATNPRAVTECSSPRAQSGPRRQTNRFLPQAARLLGVGPVQVVRPRMPAVLPNLVRPGRPDHHGVVGEVELERRSPGVHNLAFVVLLGVGGREDDHLAFRLAGQGRRDLGGCAGRIVFEERLVLLKPLDQPVRVRLELGDLRVDWAERLELQVEVASSEYGQHYQDYCHGLFHRGLVSVFSTWFLLTRRAGERAP